MVPHPVVIGLTLCDLVIREERTRKTSTVGAFTGLGMPAFPGVAAPFSVLAVLTDGVGEGTIQLEITRLDTGEDIHAFEGRVVFPDVLAEVTYHLRLRSCMFPEPGLYQLTLLVDGEWVAQRRLRVYQTQE